MQFLHTSVVVVYEHDDMHLSLAKPFEIDKDKINLTDFRKSSKIIYFIY